MLEHSTLHAKVFMNVLLTCALVAAVKAMSPLDSTCDHHAASDSLGASDDTVLQVNEKAPGNVLMQTGRSRVTRMETEDDEQTGHDENQTGRVLLQSGRSSLTKLEPSHEDRTGQENKTGRVLLQFNRSGLFKSNSSEEDELWSADNLKVLERLDNFSRDVARIGSLAAHALGRFVREAYLKKRNSTNVSSQTSISLTSMSSVVRSAGALSNETIAACRVQLGAFMSIFAEPMRPGKRMTQMAAVLILLSVLFCLLSLLVYRQRHKTGGIYGEDDSWKHESWLRDRRAFNSEPVSLAAGQGGGSFSFSRDALGSSIRNSPPHFDPRHQDAWTGQPASRESTASSIDSSASKMHMQQGVYRSGAVYRDVLGNVGASMGQAYSQAAAAGTLAGGAAAGMAEGAGASAAAGARQVQGSTTGQVTGTALSNLAQAVDSKAERLKARWEEARAAHLG